MRELFSSTIGSGGPSSVQSKIGDIGAPENGSGEQHYTCTGKNGRCSIGDALPRASAPGRCSAHLVRMPQAPRAC